MVINKLDSITFLQHVNEKGYVAVDFYDGSIMYDFVEHKTMLCDIDFFRKKPVVNDMGEDCFGTKRLKAPEEYKRGAVIDERTNVFTMGALLFEFFGTFSEEEIGRSDVNFGGYLVEQVSFFLEIICYGIPQISFFVFRVYIFPADVYLISSRQAKRYTHPRWMCP